MTGPPDTQLLYRELILHETAHTALPGEHIQETFRGIVADGDRTKGICDDISASVKEGRNDLVLTRWTQHLDTIVEVLGRKGLAPLVLRGGMSKKAREVIVEQLDQPNLVGAVLVATESFIGEGFDCPALDTVFLAFPIKFKGNVVQYVGRILRPGRRRRLRDLIER